MADDRRLEVLRAIVEDFVTTREPVGSKSLVERHALGVSPATIRNDMAVLEEQGYIAQPHTSAGRIPTDKGYRLFVDRLSEVRPMTAPERRAIRAFLDGAVGPGRRRGPHGPPAQPDHPADRGRAVPVDRRGPRSATSTSSRCPPERVLLVLIVSTGRVEQRLVDAPGHDGGTLEELRNRINAAVVGKRLDLASADVRRPARPRRRTPPRLGRRPRAAATATPWSAALADLLRAEREERIVVAGTSHLVRRGTEFPGELSTVLEALEEQVVLLRLMHDMAEEQADVAVRIGRETAHESLAQTAVVTSGYGSGDVVARLGVLGPDPDGLPHHDRGRAGRRPLRLAGARAVSAATAPQQPPTEGTPSL